jgi:hypothetical protein
MIGTVGLPPRKALTVFLDPAAFLTGAAGLAAMAFFAGAFFAGAALAGAAFAGAALAAAVPAAAFFAGAVFAGAFFAAADFAGTFFAAVFVVGTVSSLACEWRVNVTGSSAKRQSNVFCCPTASGGPTEAAGDGFRS